MLSASSMTWLLVSTSPFEVSTMPVPAARPPPARVVLMSTTTGSTLAATAAPSMPAVGATVVGVDPWSGGRVGKNPPAELLVLRSCTATPMAAPRLPEPITSATRTAITSVYGQGDTGARGSPAGGIGATGGKAHPPGGGGIGGEAGGSSGVNHTGSVGSCRPISTVGGSSAPPGACSLVGSCRGSVSSGTASSSSRLVGVSISSPAPAGRSVRTIDPQVVSPLCAC